MSAVAEAIRTVRERQDRAVLMAEVVDRIHEAEHEFMRATFGPAYIPLRDCEQCHYNVIRSITGDLV